MPLTRIEKDEILKEQLTRFMSHHGEDLLGLQRAAEAIEVVAHTLGDSSPISADDAKTLRRSMTSLFNALVNTEIQLRYSDNYLHISPPERIAIGNSPLTLGALKDQSEKLNHEDMFLLLGEEVRDKITAMPEIFSRLLNSKTGINHIIPNAGMDIQDLLIAHYGPEADNDLLPPVNSAALAKPTSTTSATASTVAAGVKNVFPARSS